jgi:SOS-response transcriptional repressor LexA
MKEERRRRFIAFFTRRYGDDRARFMLDTGFTKGRVSQLFDAAQPFGELAGKRIAEALSLPSDYFERDAPTQPEAAPVPAPLAGARLDNIEPGPDTKGLVPLISWVQAGMWAESCDVLELHEVERWLECPVPHSKCTAALRVRGDSMTAPIGAARTYPEGVIIYVDFEKKSPVNGQRIVAKIDGGSEVTFKVFKEEDGRRWLQPLNPMHEPIRDEFKVLGMVIGTWIEE